MYTPKTENRGLSGSKCRCGCGGKRNTFASLWYQIPDPSVMQPIALSLYWLGSPDCLRALTNVDKHRCIADFWDMKTSTLIHMYLCKRRHIPHDDCLHKYDAGNMKPQKEKYKKKKIKKGMKEERDKTICASHRPISTKTIPLCRIYCQCSWLTF